MTAEDIKTHWDNIYQHSESNELSWHEVFPYISLYNIMQLKLPKDATIIDVGGGDSYLVDFLLKERYTDITVLDISDVAITRTKTRLGKQLAEKVNWIVMDIRDFKPDRQYDLWHDRATFHFLTNGIDIIQYVSIANKAVKEHGYILVGTFSTMGPEKCSGLSVRQYDEKMLCKTFTPFFEKIRCMFHAHFTPADAEQNFIFCLFAHQIKNQS